MGTRDYGNTGTFKSNDKLVVTGTPRGDLLTFKRRIMSSIFPTIESHLINWFRRLHVIVTIKSNTLSEIHNAVRSGQHVLKTANPSRLRVAAIVRRV